MYNLLVDWFILIIVVWGSERDVKFNKCELAIKLRGWLFFLNELNSPLHMGISNLYLAVMYNYPSWTPFSNVAKCLNNKIFGSKAGYALRRIRIFFIRNCEILKIIDNNRMMPKQNYNLNKRKYVLLILVTTVSFSKNHFEVDFWWFL